MSAASEYAELLKLIEVSGPFLSFPIFKEVFPQGLVKDSPDLTRELRELYDEWREARAHTQGTVSPAQRECRSCTGNLPFAGERRTPGKFDDFPSRALRPIAAKATVGCATLNAAKTSGPASQTGHKGARNTSASTGPPAPSRYLNSTAQPSFHGRLWPNRPWRIPSWTSTRPTDTWCSLAMPATTPLDAPSWIAIPIPTECGAHVTTVASNGCIERLFCIL